MENSLSETGLYLGFPGSARGKGPTCQCRRCKRCRFSPWFGKVPFRRAWHPTPVFLPGESHGQRTLAGYSPWDRKEWDTTEQLTLLTSPEEPCLTTHSPCPILDAFLLYHHATPYLCIYHSNSHTYCNIWFMCLIPLL